MYNLSNEVVLNPYKYLQKFINLYIFFKIENKLEIPEV